MGYILGSIGVLVVLYLFAYIGNRSKERNREEELEVKTFIESQEERFKNQT